MSETSRMRAAGWREEGRTVRGGEPESREGYRRKRSFHRMEKVHRGVEVSLVERTGSCASGISSVHWKTWLQLQKVDMFHVEMRGQAAKHGTDRYLHTWPLASWSFALDCDVLNNSYWAGSCISAVTFHGERRQKSEVGTSLGFLCRLKHQKLAVTTSTIPSAQSKNSEPSTICTLNCLLDFFLLFLFLVSTN